MGMVYVVESAIKRNYFEKKLAKAFYIYFISSKMFKNATQLVKSNLVCIGENRR